MFELLFNRLGIVGSMVLALIIFWGAWRIIVAWRDTNGNGVIDEGE